MRRIFFWAVVVFVVVTSVTLFFSHMIAPRLVIAYSPSLAHVMAAESFRQKHASNFLSKWGPSINYESRIRHMGMGVLPDLIHGLEEDNQEHRQLAIRGIHAFEHQDFQRPESIKIITSFDAQLVKLSAATDPAVQSIAFMLLLSSGRHPEVVKDTMVAGGDLSVRTGILSDINAFGQNDAFMDQLTEIWKTDPNQTIHTRALIGIAATSNDKTIPILLEAAEKNSHGDLPSVAYALLKNRHKFNPEQDKRFVKSILTGLRDDEVRWNAMTAADILYAFPDEELRLILKEALKSDDYQTRQYSASIVRNKKLFINEDLERVTVNGLRDDNYPYDNARNRYVYLVNAREGTEWLLEHPHSGTDLLRQALHSSDKQQAFLAAWLLAKRVDLNSTQKICEILVPYLRDDDCYSTATWAIHALYTLGSPAEPFVKSALSTADKQQRDCINLLMRDWVDPPKSVGEAAHRGRLPLNCLYHDPAWEPSLKPNQLPAEFVRIRQ